MYPPLVSELFCGQFVMRYTPPHRDSLTGSVIGVSEREFKARDLRWTKDLFTLMTEDETYGEKNKQLMQEWLDKWVPLSIAAAKGLEPIWSEPDVKVADFEESFERVKSRFEDILSELQLKVPEEVTV